MFKSATSSNKNENSKVEIRLDILSSYLEARGVIPKESSLWRFLLQKQQSDDETTKTTTTSDRAKDIRKSIRLEMTDESNEDLKNVEKVLKTRFEDPEAFDRVMSFYSECNVDESEWSLSNELHYFDCLAIQSSLLSTDNASSGKSLLGRSYKTTKWDDIITSYSSSKTYLSHSIRLLRSASAYKIPFLQSDLNDSKSKLPKLLTQTQNIETHYRDACDSFNRDCIKLGVEGHDVPTEIEALPRRILRTSNVFSTLEEDVASSEDVREAVSYYGRFLRFLKQEGEEDRVVVLPVLERILNGEEEPEPLVLDHDDAMLESLSAEGLQRQVRQESSQLDNIQWDIIPSPNQPTPNNNNDNEEEEKWEIDIQESGVTLPDNPPQQEQQHETTTSEIDDTSNPPKTARLASKPIRMQLLHELIELKAFLRQRLLQTQQLRSSSSDNTATTDQLSPPELSTLQYQTYISTLEMFLTTFQTGSIANQIRIVENKRYRKSLIRKLTLLFQKVNRLQCKQDDIQNKTTKLKHRIQTIKEELGLYLHRTKQLKRDLEMEVEGCLGDGKSVVIIGEELDCLL